MDYLPLFAALKDRPVLVVGTGEIADRKIAFLQRAGAQVQIVAEADFAESQIDSVVLVIAATEDRALNSRISDAAQARHRLVNVVDDQPLCSFIFPSIVDRSPLLVAISSGGTAPVLARVLREKIEALLPTSLGRMAEKASYWRSHLKTRLTSVTERRRFWEKFFVNDRLAQVLANQDTQAVEETTEQLLSEPLDHRGEVVLVGAGPGDAGLLTLKGLQQIQQADIVVYDRLVSDDIMNLVRRDADRVFVGKRAGYHCVPQEEINQILLREAQKGKRVVRLKGGDPFIFGRGGEELETLCNAGIPFSVVPGITAASGCSAYSGIPLTHRDYAQSVRLVTGHLKTGSELDWHNLAAEKQTLVFYMGLNQAATIQAKLLEHGMEADMPVALVENGTAITQRVVDGVLTQLGELAQQVESPALIVVGRVVALREKLNWFSSH